MSPWQVLLGAALAVGTIHAQATPLSDLSSPSQEVRTRAAELIRDNHLYKATPRAPWDEMTSTFKEGDSLQDILKRIQKKGISPLATVDMFPASGVFGFQLDDSWELKCAFKNSQLIEYKIVEEPKQIWVEPPAGYNGFWRVYRIDGSKISPNYYQNGKNLGIPET
jgi:hypothetical protein